MEGSVVAIKQKVLLNFERRLDELLSFAESPIEELMIIHLYHYCRSYYDTTICSKRFHSVELIEDNIDGGATIYDIIAGSEFERKRLFNRVKKFDYRYEDGWYRKFSGFKAKMVLSEQVSLNNPRLIYWQLELYPQHEIVIKGHIYRIDVAIILNRLEGNNTIETKKIAIECDGYEYHFTKKQKEKDDTRSRTLSANGWNPLRYSGSLINKFTKEYKVSVPALFDEIIEVLRH